MTASGSPIPHDSRYCAARKKQPAVPGDRCRRPAGWGTSHVGFGRCKLHGGANGYRHGRYSAVVRQHHLPAIHEKMTNYAIRTLIDALTVLVHDDEVRVELLQSVFEAAGLARRDEWQESPRVDAENGDACERRS
jgi:hypothetical protein